MNYMKRNLFTKNDGQGTTKKRDIYYQENYQHMLSNFLSLSPSDKESTVSEAPAQQFIPQNREAPPSKQKSINQKPEFSTISSDENISYILALSEGRGHARCEVGIAAININSPHLILCQLSDNLWYSDTLTELNILNAIEILVPSTYITAHGESKLVKYIQTMYPKIKITPIPRRHFNDSLGLEMIKKLCIPSHINITLQITEKYYTVASAAALLNYLEFLRRIKFVPAALKIEYQAKYATMLIDVETSRRLELLDSLCNEKQPKSSLFGVLNYCVTAIGKRNLRAKILQPSCDIPLIKSSHSCVRELLKKEEMLFNLNAVLKKFGRVDKLLNLAISIPQEDNVKAAEMMINQALLLKACLENIPSLYEILTETESPEFLNVRKSLEDPRYNYLLEKIKSILSNTAGGQGSSQYFQRLYAVKPNINVLLDQSRKMYSDKVDEINKIVNELSATSTLPLRMLHTLNRGFHMQFTLPKNQSAITLPESFQILSRSNYNMCLTTLEITTINTEIKEIIDMIQITSNQIVSKLLMEIRQEIDAIYHLTGFITELDIIQSLTTASKIGNYCEPTIGESIKIKNGIHPLLEHNIDKTECVPNNVIAVPEFNFYFITGPNMGGKSIYIKMIAILQVMFQIGCFIPATTAEFRICDKLFSRIGHNDNIENGSSSFVVEMREMEYIIKNITPNSLVIIDELCRSTNPEEGKILAWRICEKLITMNGVSNDGKYYKDGTNDTKDESTNSNGINKLLNITSPFIFVATHFLELTKMNEQYYNVINLHLSAEQKLINGEVHLKYLHKVESGVTPISRYGLALARNVRFTSDILPRAEEILNEITENSTTSNLDFANITFNTTRDSVKISQIERALYDLTYNIVSVLRGDDTEDNKLIEINALLERFVRTQNKEFIQLIQNQTFEEILNMTTVNNTTVKSGTMAEKSSTTTKTEDLSYHSLKRRIAACEAKEKKINCAANNSNESEKPEVFSIPRPVSSRTNSEETRKQLVASNSVVVYRKSEIKQTSYQKNLRPTSHSVLEKKTYSNQLGTLSVTSSYQTNLKYLTNQTTNYKSNLPKNHNLNFMYNKSAHSLFNKFLEGSPSSPNLVTNSTQNRPRTDHYDLPIDTNQLCGDDDIDFPEIFLSTPGIDFDTSQIISLSSNDENRQPLNSESFYNVSEFGDSQTEASRHSRKGELSYQTDLYLKNIFQNEMRKHATYKTSKTKDNRILSEKKSLPVQQKSPQNAYDGHHNLIFAPKRPRYTTPPSTITSSSSTNQSLPLNNPRYEPRKSKPLATSTVTLNSLKQQNSSHNYFRPPPVQFRHSTPSLQDPMSSFNSTTNELIKSCKAPGRQVTFDLDDVSLPNNDTLPMQNTYKGNRSSSLFSKTIFPRPPSTVTSSSLLNQSIDRSSIEPSDLLGKSTPIISSSSRKNIFTPSEAMGSIGPLNSIFPNTRYTTPTSTESQSSDIEGSMSSFNSFQTKLIENLSQRNHDNSPSNDIDLHIPIGQGTSDMFDYTHGHDDTLDEHLILSSYSNDSPSYLNEDLTSVNTDLRSKEADRSDFDGEPIFRDFNL